MTQFIAPIASSAGQPTVKQRPEHDFQKFKRPPPPENPDDSQEKKKESEPQAKKPALKLVEDPDDPNAEPAKAAGPPTSTPPVAAKGTPSVASAFLQIFNLLQVRKGKLGRWLGTQAYQVSVRRQKKGGKFRKGTILDQKAE